MATGKAEVRRRGIQKHIYICEYMWGLDTNSALQADTIVILMSLNNENECLETFRKVSI